MDLCFYALFVAFRPLVMFWEFSVKIYAEVDKAINPANITWARVWEDIRHLEEMVKAERINLCELCDLIF